MPDNLDSESGQPVPELGEIRPDGEGGLFAWTGKHWVDMTPAQYRAGWAAGVNSERERTVQRVEALVERPDPHPSRVVRFWDVIAAIKGEQT